MMEIYKKKYNGESIVDFDRDMDEIFNEEYNPEVALIPKDAHGFHKGTFVVTIDWVE